MIRRIGITFILFLFLESTIASRKHLFCLINSFLVFRALTQKDPNHLAQLQLPPTPQNHIDQVQVYLEYYFISLLHSFAHPVASTKHILSQQSLPSQILLSPQDTF